MTTLTLVRHGQTDWNLARRIQGSTDIPLNETGRQQARDAADVLRTTLDLSAPHVLVASDLARARETAEIIGAELGLGAPLLYSSLRERNYGDAEGVLVDDVADRFGSWDRSNIPGAESSEALRERGILALREIVRDVRRETAPRATSIIAVSHGALIAELIRYVSGGMLPPAGERITNGSAHTFVIERDALRLERYSPDPVTLRPADAVA